MSQTTVRVVEMANHFLYLPFYYAKSRNFFGYIPSNYSIEVETSFPPTDYAALKQVLDGREQSQPSFAICDPFPLLLSEYTPPSRPVILASLITNSAIWAIDHDAPRASSIEELKAFQTIITYGEGSTTHAIARRVFGNDLKDRLIVASPGEEFTALMNHPTALLFTPDIMKAVNAMANNQKISVVLPIGSTKEYNDVMVTALATRDSVVRDHPDLVKGLLRAIQRASIIVRCGLETIINYAADRFNQSKEQVALALDAANKAMVFPVHLAVGRPQWENACQAYLGSMEHGAPEAKEKMQRLFTESVEPHAIFAQEAMRSEFAFLDSPTPDPDSGVTGWLKTSIAHPYAIVAGISIGFILNAAFGIRMLTDGYVGFLAYSIIILLCAIAARQWRQWNSFKAGLYYILVASLLPASWILFYVKDDFWLNAAMTVAASLIVSLAALFLNEDRA